MKKVFLFLFLGFLSSLWASAQIANNTSLVGTVLDPSGRAVAGAKITAVEEQTKVQSEAVTNDEGYYSITFILPGTYDITVEDKGFAKIEKTGVEVTIDVAARTDFDLTVGSDTTTVTITASTPPLSTDDVTLGETFEQKTVEEMPLSSHNALDIAFVSSNVLPGPKTSYSGNPPGADYIGPGQREIQNSLSLDGVSIMNNLISTTPDHPSAEMMSAVQVQSGNYSAQYGSYLGLHVNLVSKSGTNQLHGNVYDFVENTAMEAHGFTQLPGQATPVLHYNEYGFTLGGPVVIPKLYDGRNKTFFFGSYEKLRQIGQSNGSNSVLTPAMENGDFSALCSSFNGAGVCNAGSGTQIYDPSTGLAYTNNQIPSSELNTASAKISKAYEAYMVAPNGPGISGNLNNAYPNNQIFEQTLDRVDENIGQKVQLFFRYYLQNLNLLSGQPFASNASSGPTDSRNYAIGYTHVLTSNLVNVIYLGVNKVSSDNLNYWYANGLKDAGTKLGIPGFTGDTQYNNPGVPNVVISGYQGVGNAGSNWFQDDRTYDLYEQLSYIRGKHNIMVGAEFRRLTLGREATNAPQGQFNFTASNTTAISTGFAPADFVLGYAATSQTPNATVKGSVGEWRDGFFALDNWQVSPKITLNYGLRYDLPTAPYSLNGYGRELNAAQTALVPTSSAATAATYTPTPGYQFTPAQKDNFGPRIGVDYRFTDKTVFRAGYGMYYNPNQLNTYTLLSSNYPFAATLNYTSTAANPITFANPTPGAGSASPVAGTPGTYVSAYTPQQNMKTQRAYQWNADVGQELWRGAAVEVQYLGSHSLHLDRSYYDNEPIHPVNTSVTSLNAQRPNQLFGSIRVFQEDEYSHYNALTVVLRQREFHRLTGTFSYTWSHDLDVSPDSNNGGTTSQQYNIAADYGNANWDVRNRFVAAFGYGLPDFGGRNLLMREVAGGWHMSALINIQSGMPYTVSMASNTGAAGVDQGTERPSWAHTAKASCSLKTAYKQLTGNTNSCIDTTAYVPAANYAAGAVGYGNTHRNDLFGPGFQYENLAIFKDFPIVDRLKFQFRAEAFNLFNHPSGQNPTVNTVTIDTKAADGCNPNACLVYPSGFGQITAVQTVPGSFTGARLLELSGKIVF